MRGPLKVGPGYVPTDLPYPFNPPLLESKINWFRDDQVREFDRES